MNFQIKISNIFFIIIFDKLSDKKYTIIYIIPPAIVKLLDEEIIKIISLSKDI